MNYSFVIPCYRSENTIEAVVDELIEQLESDKIDGYEIILVDDCSPDDVWSVIEQIVRSKENVKGVCLAKNFGQHAALMAGYAKCQGDVVVSLDDDGQAPINELYKLIKELGRGNDVVYAYYEEVKQNWFRRLGTKFATLMSKIILGAPEDFKGSSFYVARKFVIDEMLRYDNAYPYLLGLVLRSTRKIGYVKTEHRQRVQGVSGYSFRKLLSLWMNGFTAFSVKPLEIGVWLGIISAVAGFIGVFITVIHKICNPSVIVGWSSTISLLLLIGGFILLMLGMIGEYVGRIYICINKAPQYVIREEVDK
ncbi:MAG: glycosyltransferase family 2 protein [Lachnospiraceae bacterium]|nr:glycosyltransferase family 2 protein [Lachnospiraceae bacterium]